MIIPSLGQFVLLRSRQTGYLATSILTHFSKVVFCRVRANHTRAITPGITLQRTSGISVRHSYAYPELLEVLYDIHTGTRDFWKFCTTVIPVPGTSGISVRQCHKYPGARVYHFYSLIELCTPVPQYPELL